MFSKKTSKPSSSTYAFSSPAAQSSSAQARKAETETFYKPLAPGSNKQQQQRPNLAPIATAAATSSHNPFADPSPSSPSSYRTPTQRDYARSPSPHLNASSPSNPLLGGSGSASASPAAGPGAFYDNRSNMPNPSRSYAARAGPGGMPPRGESQSALLGDRGAVSLRERCFRVASFLVCTIPLAASTGRSGVREKSSCVHLDTLSYLPNRVYAAKPESRLESLARRSHTPHILALPPILRCRPHNHAWPAQSFEVAHLPSLDWCPFRFLARDLHRRAKAKRPGTPTGAMDTAPISAGFPVVLVSPPPSSDPPLSRSAPPIRDGTASLPERLRVKPSLRRYDCLSGGLR